MLNDDFASMPEDMIEERLDHLRTLGASVGFRMFLEELDTQYEQIIGRIIRTTDKDDMLRTQGAARTLSDLLGKDVDGLRERMIAFYKAEIDERRERALDP